VSNTTNPVVEDCRRVFMPLTELYEELSRLRHEVSQLRKRADAVHR
jgi:hypothetical protein